MDPRRPPAHFDATRDVAPDAAHLASTGEVRERPSDPRLRGAVRPGQRFAEVYEVLSELGSGSYGAVYHARHVESGQQVALKVVHATRMNPSHLARFRREGELTARLRHPNVVSIHASGDAGGRPYLVYELVEGARTLGDCLPELSLEQRLGGLRDVAAGVGYAHQQGIVHRDLKFENVLVGGGRVRVADFGLSKAVDSQSLTQTGAMLGTPLFMSPEAVSGGELTPASDVWSLGVMLYVALTGDVPFGREGAVSVPALCAQITSGSPTRPRALSGDVTLAQQAVCLKALRKAPGERYPDGVALAEDLERVLAGEAPLALAESNARWGWIALAGLAPALVLVALFAVLAGRGEEPRVEPVAQAPPPEPPLAPDLPAPPPRPGPRSHLDHPGVLGARFLGADRMVSRSEHEVVLWDLSSRAPRRVWSSRAASGGGLLALAASADGRWFAFGGRGERVFLVDARSLEVEQRLLPDRILSLAFSPQGDSLAVGGAFGPIHVFGVPGLELRSKWGDLNSKREWAWDLAYGPRGELACAIGPPSQRDRSTPAEYRLLLLSPEGLIAARALLPGWPRSVAFASNGRVAVGLSTGQVHSYGPGLTAHASLSGRGIVQRAAPQVRADIDISGLVSNMALAHLDRVVGLRFGARGERLYSCAGGRGRQGLEHGVAVWDAASGRELARPARFRRPRVWGALDVSDGRVALCSPVDGAVEVWDLEAAFGE